MKYYHLHLQREKQISPVITKVLPKPITDSIRPKGSRLAQLYAPTEDTSMRPILSAMWLCKKLKTRSCNQYTVSDTFHFVSLEINRGDILILYDVTSLFTNQYHWMRLSRF